jgi:hypothetical protein
MASLSSPQCLIIRVLREPSVVSSFQLQDWELLVRQARRSDLLASILELLRGKGLESHIPDYALRHFEAASNLVHANATAIRWETRQVYQALAGVVDEPVLLKGAAYLFSNGPAAPGRIFQDIDLLLPKDQLEKAERALFFGGWATTHLDAYDQKYYRQWMHEIPPLRHMRRGSVLDLHHTIMPETSYIKLDGQRLRANAVTVEAGDGFSVRVLTNTDMVLHSATHLFQEGEFDHGLRDLYDLDRMMRAFGQQTGFWEGLVERAKELGLMHPLFYATRYAQRILETPVPESVIQKLQASQKSMWRVGLMDALFLRVLTCDHQSCRRPMTGVAKWLLFVRSHYIKMPLWLLIPHLIRKAVRSEDSRQDEEEEKRN